MDHIKKIAPWIVTGILTAFFLLNLHLAWEESTIMDEQAHIPAGFSYVSYGDMRLNPEHPPLLKDLAGLPLLFMHLTFPLDSKEWQTGINEQWTLGNRLIHENSAEWVTFAARIPIILIAVLLGFFIFKWTRELAGTVAGLFALVLYAGDPNIIGHSHYVTTDIGIAAFMFMAFYTFVRFLREPSGKNIWIAGLGLAGAELAKFSGVLLFPYFLLIGLFYFITKPQNDDDRSSATAFRWKKTWEFIWKYTGIVAVCFLLIWILYFFNTVNMPSEKLPAIAHTVFPQKGLGPVAIHIIDVISPPALVKPLAEYFLGVFMVFLRVAGGNTYYFLGTVTNHATPWYFPVVFLLKETLPMLFLMVVGLAYSTFRFFKAIKGKQVASWWTTFAHSFQSHIVQYAMFGFVLLYAYVSITGNLNIGFRHLFPMLPFLYVLVAKVLFDILRRQNFQGERVMRMLIGGAALWIIAIPILAYPSYLSYFNPVVGGPSEGYKYVTDSNDDWGQDMRRLQTWVNNYNECVGKDWMAINNGHGCQNPPSIIPTSTPIDKIRIDYFGGANPAYYFGDMFIPWHAQMKPEAGWYAISAGFLQESTHSNPFDTKCASTATGITCTPAFPNDWNYNWITSWSPVGRAGDSIFIFYVPKAAV